MLGHLLIGRALFGKIKVKPNRKPVVTFKRWKIVRGDVVKVRAGVDRGKVGKILKVYRKSNQVIVEGANMRLKVFRNQEEGSVQRRKPCRIHVSNVGLYDSLIDKAVRVKFGFNPQTNQKLRISKKTGKVLEKPLNEHLKREVRGKNRKPGFKDTPSEVVSKVTYQGQDFQQIRKEFQEYIQEKEKREKHLVFPL